MTRLEDRGRGSQARGRGLGVCGQGRGVLAGWQAAGLGGGRLAIATPMRELDVKVEATMAQRGGMVGEGSTSVNGDWREDSPFCHADLAAVGDSAYKGYQQL